MPAPQDRPQSHAELVLQIALAAGLNTCPHAPVNEAPVVCGCPFDRCAYLKAMGAEPMGGEGQ